MDVLNTVLLSLHPKSSLKDKNLSDYTKKGLAEMQQFQDLINMDIHRGYDGYGRRSVNLNLRIFPKQLVFRGLRAQWEATTITCLCG